MKDQIVVSDLGHSAIAVPLYRLQAEENLSNLEGYSVFMSNAKPLAYVIDAGPEFGNPILMNAEAVEKHFEFIGDFE